MISGRNNLALLSGMCAFFLAAQSLISIPANAALQGTVSTVASVDQRTIKKEVELLRFNNAFREHYTAGGKWKARRMALYNFAAGGLANAGDITLIAQFARYRNNPGAGLAHRGRLQCGAMIVLIAYMTMSGLYSTEGAYDLLNDWKSTRQGWDAKSVLKKAADFKSEIDAALADRKKEVAALGETNPAQAATLAAEGTVLEDLRDAGLVEFSRLYIDSRKRRAARDLNTLGTIAICNTGAYPGAYSVVQGVKTTNLKTAGGAAGIGFLISACLLTAAPTLIYGGSGIFGKLSNSEVVAKLGQVQDSIIDKLNDDVTKLTTASQASEEAATGYNPHNYARMALFLKDRHDFLNRERRSQKEHMLEDFIGYTAIGGPQIAWGTMLMRAGYHYTNQPSRAFGLVSDAAIVNEPSWAMWQTNVMQGSMRNEMGFWHGARQPQPLAVKSEAIAALDAMAP
jgi:hypothetical protein